MSGSDSEDDFMSDKFLATAETSTAPKTYTARRNQAALKSQRANIVNAKPVQKLAVREDIARREGLERNLFENPPEGENKAMAMMLKMGWKPGESMGKKREEAMGAKRGRENDDDDDEDEAPRGGIGSSSRLKLAPRSPTPPQRTEPIRISMWQRRKGLTARSPTPPPPPLQGTRDPDALDSEKLAKLGRATDSFRDRQRRVFQSKETESKSWKARNRLVEFDHAKGVLFHPLHVCPSAPNETIPKQLKVLLFPEYSPSPSPPPEGRQRSKANLSEAEKLRAKMRRDMLQDEEGSEDEGDLAMGVTKAKASVEKEQRKANEAETEVDWESHLSGVKRVLNEDPATYLELVVSQLRFEHLYCFWCSTQYASFPEMEGPGGCPGEDEDSH